MASSKIHVISMVNLIPLVTGGGPARANQNVSKPVICPHNQQTQLINGTPLRPTQAQVADPALVMILTQLQEIMQTS